MPVTGPAPVPPRPVTGDDRLLLSLVCPDAPAEALRAVAEAAVAEVLAPHLAAPPRWELWWAVPGEDLSRARRPRGLLWDAVPWGSPLEVVTVTAVTDGPPGPDGRPDVGALVVDLPRPRRAADGSRTQGPLVVSVSARLSALREGTVTAALGAAAVRWLTGSAAVLDAGSGYLAVDALDAGPGTPSPWERALGVSPSVRDARRWALSPGWGVVLGPSIVERVGGETAVAAAGSLRRQPLGGGRWWVDGGGSPVADDPAARAAVRVLLAPVLPPGERTVEEHDVAVPEPFSTEPRYRV